MNQITIEQQVAKHQKQIQKKIDFMQVHTKQFYQNICNLCFSSQDLHKTIDCPFSTVLYHATQKDRLDSIITNGINPHKGRLGNAVYCSDQMQMCMRYIQKKKQDSKTYILLKLKAMLTNIIEINQVYQKNTIGEKIQCLKCPYYKYYVQDTLHQIALFKCDYFIVGFAQLKFQQYSNIKNFNYVNSIKNSRIFKLLYLRRKNKKEQKQQKILQKSKKSNQYSRLMKELIN